MAIKEVDKTDFDFSDFSRAIKRGVENTGEAIVLVIGQDGETHMIAEYEDMHIGLKLDCFEESISLISEIMKSGLIKIADTCKYKSDDETEAAIDSGVYELPLSIKQVAH